MNKILQGDALQILYTLPDESVDCIITSPPYWGLRDYGEDAQIGREKTLKEYIEKLLSITVELNRILKKTGTLWWNHGDSYGTGSGAGSREGSKQTQQERGMGIEGKPVVKGYEKSLMMQPYRLALRMTDEQKWILRNIIIWHKPNAMPASVEDRFSVDYEPVFFFTKSKKYYFEQQLEKSIWFEHDSRAYNGPSSGGKAQSGEYAIDKGGAYREDGMRNKRTVWTLNTKPYEEAHFATFPESLIEPMILAGCPKGGIILDPFFGAGTTGVMAKKLGRNYIGIELNPEYIELAKKRIDGTTYPLF